MADPTIVETIGAIVTRRWGPCDDSECEADRGEEECTAWRGTVADVLDAAAEAGYSIGATLTPAGRWELPADVEVRTSEKCECGHSDTRHPRRGRCIDGLTWTKAATCACRAYAPALSQRVWTEPWRPLSATPPETAEPTVDHCLGCNGPLIERDGRRVHQANGERACPSPVTAGGGQA